MNWNRSLKTFCALLMAVLISHIPQVAAAEQHMISTNSVLAALDREETQNKIQKLLDKQDIQKALIERGVSAEEASYRLATLSNLELYQLSTQLEKAQAGGDILITILVVVLIIFLIQRM